MKFITSLVVLNSCATEYLMIFLHGLNSNGYEVSKKFCDLANQYKNIKMVFPTSEKRKVGIYNNECVNAWYNITTKNVSMDEDCQGLNESMESILDLINYYGFRPESVIIGGFSQGAAMALYTAMNSYYSFRVVLCFSGYLPCFLSTKNCVEQRIVMTHGKKDSEVPYIFGWLSYGALLVFKQCVKFISFDGPHEFPPNYEDLVLGKYRMLK
ncbi:phospholipase/carboxylesterase [Hamiltosporidium tvaerminnensis]|uniref:Acyl-protein thioesterase 1 n=1 Tax=Hamiltosporidium tvaerminnensis TaxID=1176355 RepID=A0A4Q9LC13_9MICR|nr:hypothetical protein LUQ84_000839 [Hamiltosporidium tvaerminnensis]TBU05284.1 phospholipase/carboxylesterase [Hamiltosporidium tvaerminnensis]